MGKALSGQLSCIGTGLVFTFLDGDLPLKERIGFSQNQCDILADSFGKQFNRIK